MGGVYARRVDLFALGLVLWQALIGTHPHVERCPPGRSLQRWIPAQLERNARRRVAEAAPMAPAGLCDAIERLLQPARRRTPTAEEVFAAVEPHTSPRGAAELTPTGNGRAASQELDSRRGPRARRAQRVRISFGVSEDMPKYVRGNAGRKADAFRRRIDGSGAESSS